MNHRRGASLAPQKRDAVRCASHILPIPENRLVEELIHHVEQRRMSDIQRLLVEVEAR